MHTDEYASWRDRLRDLGALGRTLAAAIENDDVVGAIATMIELRRTRSALSRLDAEPPSGATSAMLDELASLLVDARAAEAMMLAWRSRSLPGDAVLLQSPLGIAMIADGMLPDVWDFDADLIVLVGDGLAHVAEVLADLGQRRIILLGGSAPADRSIIHARATDELIGAVRTMIPVAPSQVVLRGALGVPAAELSRISDAVREALADMRIHRNTVHAFSRTWLAQAFANLPHIASSPSVASVGERFAGIPMIVIAPGPSLAGNAEQLRAAKGRALIVAFSHSLKPALAAGVVPDLVLTVDPQDVRYHFAGCSTSDSWLVNAATAHPSLFGLPARGAITLSANSALDDWIFAGLDEDAVVAGGGSVATSALSLGLRWRCDPIVFVGLDLSFPNGAYYVSTSTDGAARAELNGDGTMRVSGWSRQFHEMKASGGPPAVNERTVELPGWHGGTVPSSFMFSMFHRWFVETLGAGVKSTVFNCTEGGAFIEGMRHERLRDVLATLDRPVDVGGALDAVTAELDRDGRAARLAEGYRGYLAAMRRARKLAVRGRMAIAAHDLRGVARVERALVSVLRPVEFLSLIAQRAVEGATRTAMHDASEAEYLRASDQLLGALVGVIDELRPQLETAVGRLQYVNNGRAA